MKQEATRAGFLLSLFFDPGDGAGTTKRQLTFNRLHGVIWTHQLLIYADDVNLLGDNIDTIKRNTHTLIDASKEVVVSSPKCRAKS
jgi:hypothetical protein